MNTGWSGVRFSNEMNSILQTLLSTLPLQIFISRLFEAALLVVSSRHLIGVSEHLRGQFVSRSSVCLRNKIRYSNQMGLGKIETSLGKFKIVEEGG